MINNDFEIRKKISQNIKNNTPIKLETLSLESKKLLFEILFSDDNSFDETSIVVCRERYLTRCLKYFNNNNTLSNQLKSINKPFNKIFINHLTTYIKNNNIMFITEFLFKKNDNITLCIKKKIVDFEIKDYKFYNLIKFETEILENCLTLISRNHKEDNIEQILYKQICEYFSDIIDFESIKSYLEYLKYYLLNNY
jgi:hypothetical protein